MSTNRKTLMTPVKLLCGALLFALGVPLASAQDAAAKGPQPDLDPPQVVEAMMLALKKNTPAGIAELYRFSSPGNREKTGPLERFAVMIRQGFPDMLGHRAARAAPPLIDGERAMVPVEVQSSEGEVSRYIFLLSRQTIPACKGCWMADAVFSPEAEGVPDPGSEAPQEYGA